MDEDSAPSVFDELEVEQIEYATVSQRFVNFIIDSLVYIVFQVFVFFLMVAFLKYAIDLADTERMTIYKNNLLLFIIAVITYVAQYTLVEGASKGRSLGKFITRTKAVKEDLTPITWKDALFRALGRIIPFEGFSVFDGPAWHDSVAQSKTFKIILAS